MELGANPVKVLALIVLVAVAGLLYAYWGCEHSPLPGGVMYVCVETGETFRFDRESMPSLLPAPNKKTGRATLMPAEERGGKRFLIERYAEMLRDKENNKELCEVNKYVDVSTLEVRKK